MEEIKSVVSKKHEFENRDEPVLKTFLALLDFQHSKPGTQVIVFFQPKTPQKVKTFRLRSRCQESGL